MTRLTRRQALAATAAAPATMLAAPAFAAAEMKGPSSANFSRFTLGAFEVTAFSAGSAPRDNPRDIFGMNVAPEEFAEVSRANFLSTERALFQFTPTIVNTGSELVLFDTGLNPGATTSTLADAGYAPDQVDVVVITHMHPDHIGGLMGEAGPTFANARYITASAEHNHWSQAGSDGFNAMVAPLNAQFSFLDDGGSVVSGITAMAAFGHTPGHMTYMIESDGQQVVVFADTANHYVWSLAYPDWEVLFDMDKAAAAATRRRVLGMLAADRVPFIGYHMPFPSIGFVETRGDGFRYVPESYQLRLG